LLQFCRRRSKYAATSFASLTSVSALAPGHPQPAQGGGDIRRKDAEKFVQPAEHVFVLVRGAYVVRTLEDRPGADRWVESRDEARRFQSAQVALDAAGPSFRPAGNYPSDDGALLMEIFHIWIYCCDWAVVVDGRIVGDSATTRRIDRAARELDGQRLVDVRVKPRGARTQFLFDRPNSRLGRTIGPASSGCCTNLMDTY
jgi:hypothetical protein